MYDHGLSLPLQIRNLMKKELKSKLSFAFNSSHNNELTNAFPKSRRRLPWLGFN